MATKYKFSYPMQPLLRPTGKVDKESGLPLFILEENFIFYINGEQYTIPVGLELDGASIPSWARWYITPFDPDILCSAILHDYIYTYAGGILDGYRLDRTFTREEADQMLYDGCRALKMRYYKAKLVYWAVRIGGKSIWQKHLDSK